MTVLQNYNMADVGSKLPTFRRAIAMGRIYVGEVAFEKIKNKSLPKGDVLKLAEIAGITGAKKTSDIIPLCHPLMIDHIAVDIKLEEESFSILIHCTVSTTAKTGVEMEALSGVNAALLTIYDLTKPVEPALTISDIRLLVKEGGKKGLWTHPDGMPKEVLYKFSDQEDKLLEGKVVAVVTLSDRASKSEYEDESGKILQEKLVDLGAKIKSYKILPDDKDLLTDHLKKLSEDSDVELVVTTGGTGISPRDITPEVLEKIADKFIPGFGEALRVSGSSKTKFAWLSRSLACLVNKTIIIALPGSVKAVREGVEVIKDLIPHALDMKDGKSHRESEKKEGVSS